MFWLTLKITDTTKRVKDAADKGAFRSKSHAAASIRKDEAASITRSSDPSDPGQPPHTKRGQLKRSFRFDVDEDVAMIGPLASMVGESAKAHEFGGEYKGQEYPERPFALPALERAAPRFAEEFKGSVGG